MKYIYTFLVVSLLFSTTKAQVVYNQSFTQGLTPTTQCGEWIAFRASLTGTYSSFTIRGSQNMVGVSCTDPVVAQAVADALQTGSSYTGASNGETWTVGLGCSTGLGCSAFASAVELSTGSDCICASLYSIRPEVGNDSWGGIGGNTCGAVSQTIIVEFFSSCVPTIAPTITAACPSNITVNNGAGLCGGVVNYAVPAGTDDCGTVTATLTSGLASGAIFPIGTTTNTYRFLNAIDTVSCSFTVTVTDTESPVLTCPVNMTVNNDIGQCNAIVNYSIPAGTDNCAGVTTALTSGPASGSTFPLGTTTVTYMATDAAGNTSVPCSFTVTVVDSEVPILNCPSNIAVVVGVGQCDAVVNYIAPVGTDNCAGVTTTLIGGLASGSSFPTGITTVTYSATDAAGNTTPCSFTVTVIENEAPMIACPANIIVNSDTGLCGAIVNYTAPVGTDNCVGSTTTLIAGPASGETFSLGTTLVSYRVTDAAGNIANCSFTVTVVDAEAPTITCPGNITVNNEVGQCSATVNYTTPLGADNCTGVTTALTAGLSSGSTFPLGTTTVTYMATDAAGNTSVPCSFTVTVVDSEAPMIVCPVNIMVNNTAGQCDAVVNYTSPVGSDNCTGVTVALTAGLPSGSTFPLGITTVAYMATDAAGNTSLPCSFTVTVIENEAPVIICPGNITVNNTAGQCDAVVNYATPIGTDNCIGVTTALTAGLSSGSTFPLGTTTVTYTATDFSGNIASCSFTVTVLDAEEPTITCSANITVNNDAGQCDAAVNYTSPVGSDNCAGVTTALTAGLSSGSTFPLGTTTVSYMATDATGNTSVPCSFTVTVVDSEAPMLVCPVNITVNNDTGQCDAVVNYTSPVGSDNCVGVTTALTAGLASGSVFPLGTTTVTYMATDAAGNTSVPCSFTVTVVDAEAPEIICPASITVNNDTGQCSAVVNYTIPVGSDNCAGVTTALTTGLASGSTFPLGVTTVTYTATDFSGNITSCSFTVTVLDVEEPTITCSANITVNNDVGQCDAVINYTAPIGTDNCTGFSVALTAGLSSGSTFPLGITTVTYMATDASGNTSVPCSFTVTVVDAEAPMLVCPANITVNNDAGQCDAVVNYMTPVGTDNCAGATTTLISGLASGSTFPIGITTISYSAIDVVGNTSDTCAFTVTVIENEAPVITCPADITVNNDTGQCDAVVIYTAPIGTDNCVGVTTVLTAGLSSGSAFPIGATIVTYTTTDAVGNTTLCSFTVTVVDVEVPVITCQADMIVSNDLGTCDAIVNYTTPIGIDSCSIATTVLKTGLPSGSIFPLGITTITYAATDVAGNIDSCSFTITVVDTTIPTITCPMDISSCNDIVNGIAPLGTSDNCIGEYVTFTLTGATIGTGNDDASGTVFNVGTTTVWYHVTDSAGNNDSCSFNVDVFPLPTILLNSFDTDTVCISSDLIPLPIASPSGGTYSGLGVVGTTFDPATAGVGTHYVFYSFTDANSCSSVDSVIIVVDLCVGIDENTSLSEVNIYPNPTNGIIHVDLAKANGSINYTLLTIEGRIVNQGQDISSKKITLNLNNQNTGIYLLQIEDKTSSKVYKIIKE